MNARALFSESHQLVELEMLQRVRLHQQHEDLEAIETGRQRKRKRKRKVESKMDVEVQGEMDSRVSPTSWPLDSC